MSEPYPRDLVGYGEHPPHPRWPGDARLALSCVLNYEEGGERSILHGDPVSEVYLHEVPGGTPLKGARSLSVESIYEYGARAGFWRVRRLFAERGLTLTVYAVGMALERNPAAARAMVEFGFRGRQSRLALDRLSRRARGRGARAHPARDRGDRAGHGRASGRLVHRTDQPEHPSPGRRGRRVPLRIRTPMPTICRTGRSWPASRS